MASIDTPLLVVGSGPAALVVAKVASGHGLPSVLAGHEALQNRTPVVLTNQAQTILRPHGVLDVLRPYAVSQDPFAIAPVDFENGLKHHCVADMLITVLDRMTFRSNGDNSGALSDGRTTWDVQADALVDAADLPIGLNDAVEAAAQLAEDVVRQVS